MADTDKIETVKNYGVSPLWKHWEEPTDEDPIGIELGGEKYILTRKDAVQLSVYIQDVAGVKVVPK